MSMWTQIPDTYDEHITAIAWQDSENALLLRNADENVVLRLHDVTASTYETLCEYLETGNALQFKIDLLSAITDATDTTQLGQHDCAEVDGVANQFKYKCPTCQREMTFQIKGKYRGPHATCISCGTEASIIPSHCESCATKRVFIKLRETMEWYTCRCCGHDLQ